LARERVNTDGPLVNIGENRVRLTESEALTNVRTVLELCAAGKVKCSATTGRPSTASILAIVSHLADGDFYALEPIASFAWPLLLQAGGLAKLDGTRLQLTTKGVAALKTSPEQSIRLLWQRWLTHAVIDEFSRIENIKGQRSRNVLTAAKHRRQMVDAALTAAPTEEWIEVDTLFSLMQQEHLSPTIARSERHSGSSTSSIRTTAALATPTTTSGTYSKAGTPLRSCSSMRAHLA
jgi:hypothetical protein